jgi:hypothetical protein
MLDVLYNQLALLKQIYDDLPALLAEVAEENADHLEEANRDQLREGKRADGSDLPDYSPASVSKFGKRPGPMTLEKTGAFYRGIKLKVYKSQKFAEIVGTDPKTGKLEALYGLNIIDIPEDFIEGFCESVILPSLLDKVNKKYFL